MTKALFRNLFQFELNKEKCVKTQTLENIFIVLVCKNESCFSFFFFGIKILPFEFCAMPRIGFHFLLFFFQNVYFLV